MIFFLVYNIKIHIETSEFEDIGSKARCWIKAPTIEAADLIVRNELKKFNWEILGIQESREVQASDYVENSTERQNFNEATAKGTIILIDTKPKRKSSP